MNKKGMEEEWIDDNYEDPNDPVRTSHQTDMMDPSSIGYVDSKVSED